MARINVDDDIESRPEYWKLLKILNGNHNEAMGMLLRFWRLAQKHWGNGELVPVEEMEEWEFLPLIDSKWATIRENGVYAKGSEERFDWYRQKCDAAKKGGEARASGPRDESGQFVSGEKTPPAKIQPKSSHTPAEYQPEATQVQPATSPLVLSLVPVPSPDNKKIQRSRKNKNSKAIEQQSNFLSLLPDEEATRQIGLPPAPHEGLSPVTRFIHAYATAYRKRYAVQTGPELTPEICKQIKNFLSGFNVERAIQLVQVYLQMDEKWFETKSHDFYTFKSNLNMISRALETGQNPTGINWKNVFGEEYQP